MLKLTPIEFVKNKFMLTYSVCHTNVNEHDIWMYAEPVVIDNVENEEDLKEYLECFNIVKLEVDKARTGHGEVAEYIDFEKYVDDGQYDQVEWRHAEGVSFIKNGKEYFVFIDDDIGMPTEDGHFLQGIELVSITYFDANGIENYVTIE